MPRAGGAGQHGAMKMRSVLIVDDSPAFRQALRALVDRIPGLRVIGEAHDGEQALVAVTMAKPEVVVIDLAMPAMNGLHATRLIKGRLPATFVVLISIKGDESVRQEAAAAGADAFVWKGSIDTELPPLLRSPG